MLRSSFHTPIAILGKLLYWSEGKAIISHPSSGFIIRGAWPATRFFPAHKKPWGLDQTHRRGVMENA